MFLRFLLVGGAGFLIDAGLTWMLIVLGLRPWWARVPAILAAMAFTWLANRHFTYAIKSARTANEATRYFLTAIVMALMNYGIYVFLVNNGVMAVLAVALATGCQAVLSFYVYRDLVFKEFK